MHVLSWLGTVALLQAPPVPSARETPAIAPASRLRITDLDAGQTRRRSGTVLAARRDTVVMRFDGSRDTVTLPLVAISGLEVSTGRHGHAAAGLGIGFLVGAGTGALVGVIGCRDNECYSGSDDMTGPVIGALAVLGGVAGGLIGVIAGATHQTDTWEAVDRSRWHFTAAPTGAGGFTFALALRL